MERKLRWTLWPVLVIGVVLIIAPFAISLPSKGGAGQDMLDNFHSMMQPQAVATTVKYFTYFEDLKPVAQAGPVAATEIPSMFQGLASGMHLSETQLAGMMEQNYPALAQMLAGFPQLSPVFKQVGAGLDWYKPIIATMSANQSNYAKVDSLPNFKLFTWFFVIPGILLVLLSGAGLLSLRRTTS